MKKPVEFDSQGSRIQGWFYCAEGEPPFPTILLLKGFPVGGDDVLGLGQRMMQYGVNTLTFNYRGTFTSEGVFSHRNAQQDIQAAITYLHGEAVSRFQVDTSQLILGGHSYGGCMGLAYAIDHPGIKRIVSVAGGDAAEHLRECQRNPGYVEMFAARLKELQFPTGPVRFESEPDPLDDEIAQDPTPYDLRLNAPALADRDILLIGGWDDFAVLIEQYTVPVYRALVKAGAPKVRILAFQDDHGFERSREDLAATIVDWVKLP